MKTNYARHVRTCCEARKVKITQFKGWRYFDKFGKIIHEDLLPKRKNRGQVLDEPPRNLKKALAALEAKKKMTASESWQYSCFNKIRRGSIDKVLPSELAVAIIYQLEKLYTCTHDCAPDAIRAVKESLTNLAVFRKHTLTEKAVKEIQSYVDRGKQVPEHLIKATCGQFLEAEAESKCRNNNK